MKGDADDHNMINLLHDSASDSQEILTLPPLKSKRSKLFGKKKKTQFEEPSCNPCTSAKYFIAILAFAGLIAVALVTFLLLHQVENLKKEFQSGTGCKIWGEGTSRLHCSQCITGTYFIDPENVKGKVNLGGIGTKNANTDEMLGNSAATSSRRSRSNVCTTCLTVSGFLVLVACLVACGTLLWMHFALRKNLDYFQKKLETVERKNQFTPEEFQKLHTQIQELNKTLNNYKSGKNGLQAILYNVTLLTKDIATLKENSASLQKSLAKAPSLESLPTEVETMSKSLRSQGSDLAALKTQVEKDFLVDTANFENITASMKELRAEIKQLQIEKGHADNFTYDFTRLTTQFQEDLNSTEVKLKDQILQLQKQFYIFESQLNETTTAANTTTTTTSTDVTTSTTNPPTNSIPSSTAKAVSKK